jgi:hypothetical protein
MGDIVVKTKNPVTTSMAWKRYLPTSKGFESSETPRMCFRFPKGKLLGFMVLDRGIEANQEK